MTRNISFLRTAPRAVFRAGTLALGLALAAWLSQVASAASISYGNFGPVPPGVTFINVTESSGTDPVPLYGPPTPFSVGLDFDPKNFVASANGGGADITDGQLNFTIKSPLGIGGVDLNERGDYTLAGAGTTASQVLAGVVILATVTEINGLPVAPIPLPAANASVGFNLVANPGIVQPWSIGSSINIPGAIGKVTRLDVAINNQLLAISELGSIAFIAKKDFVIHVRPDVPEPATAVLMLIGGTLAAIWVRRRSE